MPTYEYRCTACGSRFEEFQKMSDEPVEDCPECGRPEAERVMSAGAGLVFKGSGFYETDYKRSGPEGEGEEARDSGPADGDGGDADSSGADGGEAAAGDGDAGGEPPS